jgi:hypothetical protein
MTLVIASEAKQSSRAVMRVLHLAKADAVRSNQ